MCPRLLNKDEFAQVVRNAPLVAIDLSSRSRAVRASAVAARLKPSRFHSSRPQRRSALSLPTRVRSTAAAS